MLPSDIPGLPSGADFSGFCLSFGVFGWVTLSVSKYRGELVLRATVVLEGKSSQLTAQYKSDQQNFLLLFETGFCFSDISTFYSLPVIVNTD